MPLYEYECLECGTRVEVIQRLKERTLKKLECEECGEVRLVKKLLSAPAFQFKGEGWYVTDYADKKGKQDTKKDGDDASKTNEGENKDPGKKKAASSEGSSTKKAESKPKESAKSGDSAKAKGS